LTSARLRSPTTAASRLCVPADGKWPRPRPRGGGDGGPVGGLLTVIEGQPLQSSQSNLGDAVSDSSKLPVIDRLRLF
jgi:hypothetical protein